jgi:ABC-type phosphate transport system substrate-binding protein
MKHALIAVVIASVLAVPSVSGAQDAGLKIVGNPGTTPDGISKTDLARIFLKKKTKWSDGRSAEPVGQKRAPELNRVFSSEILGMTLDMVESHWQAQVFSGRGTPPRALGGDIGVLDYVRRTPGAVGYVSGGAVTSGVTVLKVID